MGVEDEKNSATWEYLLDYFYFNKDKTIPQLVVIDIRDEAKKDAIRKIIGSKDVDRYLTGNYYIAGLGHGNDSKSTFGRDGWSRKCYSVGGVPGDMYGTTLSGGEEELFKKLSKLGELYERDENNDGVTGKPVYKKISKIKLSLMNTFSNSQLDNEARQMREHLTKTVSDFGKEINNLKLGGNDALYADKLTILFKKFSKFFKEDFNDSDRKRIVEAFKAGKILKSDDPTESVYAVFNQHMFLTKLRDGVAQRGVTTFLDVFADQKQYFTDHPELANEFYL